METKSEKFAGKFENSDGFRSSLRKVFGPSRVVGSLEGPRGQGVPPGSPDPSAIYNLGGCRLSGIWVGRVVHVLHQVAIDGKTPMDVRYLCHFFQSLL